MAKKNGGQEIPENFLSDYFLEIGLDELEQEEIKEDSVKSPWKNGVPPPTFTEFLESSEWLDEAYDWETHTGARPVMIEQGEKIMKKNVREAILILGSGSGKGYLSSRLACYMATVYLHLDKSQRYYGFTEGDPVYIVNLALNKDQAKNVIFAYIKACVERCDFLKSQLKMKDHIGVDKIEFDKGLTIISGDSNFQGFYGYNILMGVLDELAFYDRVKKKDGVYVDYARDGWLAINATKTHGNLKDHYKCVGITTAGSYDCFAETFYDQIKDEKDKGQKEGHSKYCERLPTWEVKPNITREDFDNDFKIDYNHACAKYGAQKGFAGDSYYSRDEKERFRDKLRNSGVQNLYIGGGRLEKMLIKPIPDARYYIHIDKSEKHDRLAIVMGHLHDKVAIESLQYQEDLKEIMGEDYHLDEGEDEKMPVVKIDLVAVIDPKGQVSDDHFLTMIKNTRRINSPQIRSFIYMIRKYGYNIVQVSFDRHEKDEYEIKFHERGLETKVVSSDTNKSISQMGKTAMLAGRVICPWNQVLSDELDWLIDTGRKIDHVEKGFKDVYDAFSSVIYEITADSSAVETICEPMFETGDDEQDFVENIRHNRYAGTFRNLGQVTRFEEDDDDDGFVFDFNTNDEYTDAYGEIL